MYRVNEKLASLINRVKQPEYTGENRCLPCTVLNTAIAVAIAIAVALISPAGALAIFVISVSIIGLRGYLIPGTPTLVTYLPDWVHNRLGPGNHSEASPNGAQTAESAVDVERTLKRTGIIEECDDIDDLCLTDEFQSDWELAMSHFDSRPNQRARLAETLDVAPETISFEETDNGLFVYVGDVRAGRWLSEAAFIADLASEQILSTGLPQWTEFQDAERTELLVALRTFVERCPSCGGAVETDESTRRSCCREDILSVTGSCSDCDATVFSGNVS